MNKIKVLTYNIHKGLSMANRRSVLEQMRTAIEEVNADVVCVQEVSGINSLSTTASSQFEFLAERIWPHHAYGKNATYSKGHHGNAILSRYPIVDWHNLNLTTYRFEKRGLLHVKLQISENIFVHILNVHLDLFDFSRSKQALKIRDYIKKNIHDDQPVVLCGDFNDWQKTMSTFFAKEVNLQEVFFLSTGKHALTFPAIKPILPLDRIYYTNLKLVEHQTLHKSPWHKLSDHIALTASFII